MPLPLIELKEPRHQFPKSGVSGRWSFYQRLQKLYDCDMRLFGLPTGIDVPVQLYDSKWTIGYGVSLYDCGFGDRPFDVRAFQEAFPADTYDLNWRYNYGFAGKETPYLTWDRAAAWVMPPTLEDYIKALSGNSRRDWTYTNRKMDGFEWGVPTLTLAQVMPFLQSHATKLQEKFDYDAQEADLEIAARVIFFEEALAAGSLRCIALYYHQELVGVTLCEHRLNTAATSLHYVFPMWDPKLEGPVGKFLLNCAITYASKQGIRVFDIGPLGNDHYKLDRVPGKAELPLVYNVRLP